MTQPVGNIVTVFTHHMLPVISNTVQFSLQHIHIHYMMYMYMYRMSRVQIPPEAALLFFLGKKKELSSGVVALLCLVSMTDCSCTCSWYYMYSVHVCML